MVDWPIRRKLLMPPSAMLALVATASLAVWASDTQYTPAIAACLGVALCALLAVAWLTATDLTQRLTHLREALSQLIDRGAPAGPEATSGDEILLLSNRLHKAVFRGRERETQIRRSTELLEFAQTAGGFGVFDLDLVTGQVIGTPIFFELIDLANTDALFTRDEWLATIHPDDFEDVVRHLNTAITTAGRFQADYRSRLQDGGTRWLSSRGRVMMDNEGFPARAIGTLTDVTEYKERAATP